MSLSDRLKLMNQQYGTNSTLLQTQEITTEVVEQPQDATSVLQDYMQTATQMISDKEFINRTLFNQRALLKQQVAEKLQENIDEETLLTNKISALKYHLELMESQFKKGLSDFADEKIQLELDIQNTQSLIVNVKSLQVDQSIVEWVQKLEKRLK